MITVTEYAELQCYDKTVKNTFKRAYISQDTLDWLIDNYQHWTPEDIDAEPVLIDFKKNSFKLGAYVGYIQSPFNDEQIQILPKIEIVQESTNESKIVLKQMLATVYDLKARELSNADLDHQDLPLHEWIITKFLNELEELLHVGLKRDYELVQDSQPFVKGRLLISQQMRKGPGQEAIFDLEYDEFLFNGIENRLIHTALQYVLKLTNNDDSLLRAFEFCGLLETIPLITYPIDELQKWRDDRLLEHYAGIRPWCEIILNNISPSFQYGANNGISLLFSMPYVFEKYVAKTLKIKSGLRLLVQPSQRNLIQHQPKEAKQQEWFKLKPDLAIREGSEFKVIIDTKWKFIDECKKNSKDKYEISQTDLYQMFAYGQKYLEGCGKIVLIYPMHKKLNEHLPVFNFSEELKLYVLPFDLKNGSLAEQYLVDELTI